MVHGRAAYMLACGPRTYGAKPGSVSVCGRSATSDLVYSALSVMPSAVSVSRRDGSPPGADLAAARRQSSSEAAAMVGSARGSVMTKLSAGGFATIVPCPRRLLRGNSILRAVRCAGTRCPIMLFILSVRGSHECDPERLGACRPQHQHQLPRCHHGRHARRGAAFRRGAAALPSAFDGVAG